MVWGYGRHANTTQHTAIQSKSIQASAYSADDALYFRVLGYNIMSLCLIQKPKRPGNLKSSAARGM